MSDAVTVRVVVRLWFEVTAPAMTAVERTHLETLVEEHILSAIGDRPVTELARCDVELLYTIASTELGFWQLWLSHLVLARSLELARVLGIVVRNEVNEIAPP